MTPSERRNAPDDGDEVATLRGFLDHHRDTLRLKTGGLDARQLATPLPPSELTLGGLLKHMAFVEDHWFSHVLMAREYAEPWASADWEADRDWEFHSAADDSPEELHRLFDESVERADRILDDVVAADGLGRLAARERHGRRPSLRWILVHMVEEYARHNGHADLIRESVDGSTGA